VVRAGVLVDGGGMELEEAEARARFGSVPVARLATADATGRPHVVPVTFAVEGDRVLVAVDGKPKRTRRLRRLRNIRENPRVAVLADVFDPEDWSRLWWVRADGTARVLDAPELLAGPLDLLAARYRQYRDARPAGPVIEITVERWLGWSGADG